MNEDFINMKSSNELEHEEAFIDLDITEDIEDNYCDIPGCLIQEQHYHTRDNINIVLFLDADGRIYSKQPPSKIEQSRIIREKRASEILHEFIEIMKEEEKLKQRKLILHNKLKSFYA